MLPDPLETLRHELPSTLARRPDLADLERNAGRSLRSAREERDHLARERDRLRQDWREWIINGVGGTLAVAGLARMILAGEFDLFSLLVSGFGSCLTLYGASRFFQKVGSERDLHQRIERLTERVESLDQARRRLQEARRLRAEP